MASKAGEGKGRKRISPLSIPAISGLWAGAGLVSREEKTTAKKRGGSGRDRDKEPLVHCGLLGRRLAVL